MQIQKYNKDRDEIQRCIKTWKLDTGRNSLISEVKDVLESRYNLLHPSIMKEFDSKLRELFVEPKDGEPGELKTGKHNIRRVAVAGDDDLYLQYEVKADAVKFIKKLTSDVRAGLENV